MHAGGWWLRLSIWEWSNAWRLRPVWRTVALLGWVLPVVAIPLALLLGGKHQAEAALAWLLSFDVPMALVLTAQSGSAIVALAARPDTEDWISPAAARRVQGRALFLARLVHATRWPLGLALAALLLSLGGGGASAQLVELLLIVGFFLLGGASLAWMLRSRRSASDPSTAVDLSLHGLSALSRVPLREAGRQLDVRRVGLLAVPLLLAAPMGTAVQQLLWALATWVLLLHVGNWIRQALRAGDALRAWMPHMQLPRMHLYWWLWRYVVAAAVTSVAALWLAWHLTHPAGRNAP